MESLKHVEVIPCFRRELMGFSLLNPCAIRIVTKIINYKLALNLEILSSKLVALIRLLIQPENGRLALFVIL